MLSAFAVATLGLVGLGLLGSAVAGRLRAAGHDIVAERVRALVALGGRAAPLAEAVARDGPLRRRIEHEMNQMPRDGYTASVSGSAQAPIIARGHSSRLEVVPRGPSRSCLLRVLGVSYSRGAGAVQPAV